MNISCDAIGYSELGRMLQNDGMLKYFETGPQREPAYPLLISLAMHIEGWTGIVYTKIMAAFGVVILLISQILVYAILRRLNVRAGICAAVLLYFGFSPALNNTAFSLYSEIATYPFILGIVLISGRLWEASRRDQRKSACLSGAALGLLFAGVTLIKAVFEIIFPAYTIIFLAALLLPRLKIRRQLQTAALSIIVAIGCYYAPITAYKQLNKIHNGNFAITNRGSWALYGNTARRMEPLTFKRFLTALVYVPGEGVCTSLFSADECRVWSFYESDTFGLGKLNELNNQGLSKTQIDTQLIKMSKEKILQNPFQYVLLMIFEGGKMFFWESTQIGFVQY
ncbi:MAG: hypothetical protein Q7T18_02740, partial [Sedimentisphaerales bacterium]|nr:hypothetical protein [Sedimentisphaerales bacterium]